MKYNEEEIIVEKLIDADRKEGRENDIDLTVKIM